MSFPAGEYAKPRPPKRGSPLAARASSIGAQDITPRRDSGHARGGIPVEHRRAAGARHEDRVRALAAIVPRPFGEHELGAEQDTEADAAILGGIEPGPPRANQVSLEEAGFLRKVVLVVDRLDTSPSASRNASLASLLARRTGRELMTAAGNAASAARADSCAWMLAIASASSKCAFAATQVRTAFR